MPIFGKKKKSEGGGFVPTDKAKELLSKNLPEIEVIESLKKEGFSAEEIDKALVELSKHIVEMPKEVKREKPMIAPLFIKLDRYRQILSHLQELRRTLGSIKNAFSILNELDRLRYENMKSLQGTIELVDKKLADLDSEFLRPAGFQEEVPSEEYVEGLETELDDLKNQVNELKSELKDAI